MKSSLLGLIVIAALVTACEDSATAPAELAARGVMIGIIEVAQTAISQPGSEPLVTPIAAPDTVQVNVPFAATITTIGLNSCWRNAGASVVVTARRAVIRPFDQLAGDQAGCFQALVNLPRTVSIVFTQPGDATLRVEGRRVLDHDLGSATSVAIEKRIYVR